MANPNDGTLLNAVGSTGDTIATEDMPVGSPRQNSNLPATDYKIGRSKLAVGDFDQDAGDMTAANPLQVRSLFERQEIEIVRLRDEDIRSATFGRRSVERIQMIDSRGGSHRGSSR